MNIVIVTQKPIQTLNLIYLLGGIDVFPSAVVSVLAGANHTKLGLLDESRESSAALMFQCNTLDIPYYAVDDVQSKESIKLLSSLQIDLILSFITDVILNEMFIGTSKHGVVSSHGGVLPEYRGVDCLRWAILNRERNVGMSVQLLDAGVDTGDIVSVKRMLLSKIKSCSVADINKKIFYQEKLYAYIEPVKQLLKKGKIDAVRQDMSTGKQYFSMHRELSSIVDDVLAENTK